MARTLKQTKTIDGSTSSSSWTWKQVISEYFDDDYIITNKSVVVVQSYLGVPSGKSAASFGGTATTNITCNGDSRSKSQTWIYQSFYINPGEWKLIQEETFTITHDNDGKKSISVSSSLSTSDFNPNSASASGKVELTTIPRASDIAVSNTELGQNIPITIGKKVDEFTSTLSYTIGSLTGTIVEKTSLSSYPWVMSDTLINQIKNAYPSSGSYANGGISATVTCKTYNGTTLIGTTTATFKLYITDKPTISNVVRTELNSKISALTTSVLRHASQNKFTITATAPTGTTIANYRVKNGTQDSGLSTSNDVNLNDIQTFYDDNGTLKTKFIITCIDARGNESEEYPLVCDFINYIQVSINKTDVVIKRTNNVSTDCLIYLKGNFFNGSIGSTSNAISLKCRYKQQGTTTWSEWVTLSVTYADNVFKANNVSVSGTFDYKENYDIELVASDVIEDSDNFSKVFVNSVPTELHHKKGAWIRELDTNTFKIGTLNVLDVLNSKTIYDSGSNNNGSWIRDNDGNMVCYGVQTFTVDFASFWGMIASGQLQIEYSQSFVDNVSAMLSVVVGDNIWLITQSTETESGSTTHSQKFRALRPSGMGTEDDIEIKISYLAIGKWKEE